MATIDFTTLNTNKTPNKKGQQYLDANEVKEARAKGCVWLNENETYTENAFNIAMKVYFTNRANSNPFLEAQKNIFNTNDKKLGIPDPNNMFNIPGSVAFGGNGAQAGRLPR